MKTDSKHEHIYDENGDMVCCSLEQKIDKNSSASHDDGDDTHTHSDGHSHDHDEDLGLRAYLPAGISLLLLLSGLAIEHWLKLSFFSGGVEVAWYVLAYLPVALPVIKESYQTLKQGEIFTEFFLMSIATLGAFAIGEYPEGVAVMLFYAIGELFQTSAVRRAKTNIKELLDVRPKSASVKKDGKYITVSPDEVAIGSIIQVKVGEKIPLDGVLLSDKTSVNTSALTGESKPAGVKAGEKVMAGSINLEQVIELKVTKLFEDSSISRILELVQNATSRKSKTELLIRRLAKIYTPIVVYLALAICMLPYFIVENYVFSEWLYRALVFLVISCPCALVISIPLGYFGGLGAASKNGLLFKGATYLDQLTKVNHLVMDKTGTVTKGVFKIKDIVIMNDMAQDEFMLSVMALESKSTHPIAKAVMEYSYSGGIPSAKNISEVAGKGLKGEVKGREILLGNKKLLEQFNIEVPEETQSIVETIIMVAIGGEFSGYITIADELKEDAFESIAKIKQSGINNITMLSGDKDSITQQVASSLNIDNAIGGLLPEEKLNEVMSLKKDPAKVVAFVGDGINDAPVLAASDVSIAMGGLGSDVAIETADVIIQTDQPSKISMGIEIGKSTQRVIWQNIILAFVVKIIVLILGASGLATMWEAVFADVGVSLLAILNAVRLQKMNWGDYK